MNENLKFFSLLIIAVIVSATTSYAVAISRPLKAVEAEDIKAIVEQQVTEQLSKTKINFGVRQEIYELESSRYYVEVYISKPVDNFTIIYDYNCLNGTRLARSVDYGSISPNWDADVIIHPETLPYLSFGIPGDIVSACSTMIPTNETTYMHWGISPYTNIDISEVYGYA